MTINQFALVSGMTDFYHIGTMSRLYETLRNRDIVDPTYFNISAQITLSYLSRISLISPSYLPTISLLSPYYLPSILSPSYLPPVSLLSPSYLIFIFLISVFFIYLCSNAAALAIPS